MSRFFSLIAVIGLSAVAAAPAAAVRDAEPAKRAANAVDDKNPAAEEGAAKQADASAGIDAEGYIRTWLVAGPIPVETPAEDLDKAQLPDEGNLKPKEGDKAKAKDKEVTWKKVTAADAVINFTEALNAEEPTNVAAYAVAYVEATDEVKNVTLLMGTDDQGKVYLNGKELAKFAEPRALEKDADKAENLTLKKGTNVVVLKVINETVDWQGCVRLTDKDGKPVMGLKVKTAP